MFKAVIGLPGSGLTESCLAYYHDCYQEASPRSSYPTAPEQDPLIHSTHSQHSSPPPCNSTKPTIPDPARILFLVRSQKKAAEVIRRFQQLEPTGIGRLRIQTFLSFVLEMLSNYWADVRAQIPQLPATFEPQVLPKDLTQYLLSRTCALCPQHGPIFEKSRLRDYQLWDQLSSAAYIAGSSDLDLSQVGSRLCQAWPDLQAEFKLKQLHAVGCCVSRLRSAALEIGSLDYGTQISLFNQVILHLPQFWESLDHVIVDQAEESTAVALNFYEQGLDRLQSLFLAYTIGGGEAFTSVPNLVAQFVNERSEFRILSGSYKSTPEFVYLGDQIAHSIDPEFNHPLTLPLPDQSSSVRFLEGETFMDAVEQMIEEIRLLLDQGIQPAQIAVIAPKVDPSLAITLQDRLGDFVVSLTPYPSLIKYPLIRALLSMIELGHPDWGSFPTLSELKLMLGILLNIDPIRAELLAEDVFDPVNPTLRSSLSVRLPERIGFAKVRLYQTILDWLNQYRQGEALKLDRFLQQVFTDLLATVITAFDQQLLIQGLIESAHQFQITLPQLHPRHFLDMIRSSQTPNQRVLDLDYQNYLVIAPPIGYINQALSADYQFWFNLSDPLWARSLWRPLYNPQVLTPEWDLQPFGEAQDHQAKQQILAKTLLNLCCRTRRELWLIRSNFNIKGEENTGILDQQILEVLARISD